MNTAPQRSACRDRANPDRHGHVYPASTTIRHREIVSVCPGEQCFRTYCLVGSRVPIYTHGVLNSHSLVLAEIHSMHWRNDQQHWGLVAIFLHWTIACATLALFGLGLWMTGLDYYDLWYRKAPDLHRSAGILLSLAVIARLLWRWLTPVPQALPSHRRWELIASATSHTLLYLLPLALAVSGYLISTADERAIAVFNWFEIPATYTGIEQQEEVMGDVHEILAWGLIGLVAVHTLGAIKHHVVDRDTTLTRMLGMRRH